MLPGLFYCLQKSTFSVDSFFKSMTLLTVTNCKRD